MTITLSQVIERKHIDTRFRHNLTALRPSQHEADFEQLDTGETVTVVYDMIHVTPPMSPPDFIRQSPLAADTGWVSVHKHTLQHTAYPNIFGIGDCSNLPTSKTGAAIRKQVPTLVKNLLATLYDQPMTASYTTTSKAATPDMATRSPCRPRTSKLSVTARL